MGEGGKMTDYVDKIWLGDRLWVGGGGCGGLGGVRESPWGTIESLWGLTSHHPQG
jgi:hypothetical protein